MLKMVSALEALKRKNGKTGNSPSTITKVHEKCDMGANAVKTEEW